MVKAFNVFSAYLLALRDPGQRTVPIASDDQEAKEVISDLINKMGFIPVDLGKLVAARQVSDPKLLLRFTELLVIIIINSTGTSTNYSLRFLSGKELKQNPKSGKLMSL